MSLSNQPLSPICPVFGVCGGCSYQHLSYDEEIEVKEKELRSLFPDCLPTIRSPKIYHYRHRLDIAIRRLKTGEIVFGYVHPQTHHTIAINQCPIGMEAISNFIPTLKEEASAKLPPKYKVANLTIKTGDDGRILWGGIGKQSLKTPVEEALWTIVDGEKIFYSLDTFFQANLSILPLLKQKMTELMRWNKESVLYDLYGGVGLFSVMFAKQVKQVILIEENAGSLRLAEFNKSYHQFNNWDILNGKVEVYLETLKGLTNTENISAIIDPPRAGLSPLVRQTLAESRIPQLLYLSCNPYSLKEDLKEFLKNGWKIKSTIPFDFFPRTRHLEVLTALENIG